MQQLDALWGSIQSLLPQIGQYPHFLKVGTSLFADKAKRFDRYLLQKAEDALILYNEMGALKLLSLEQNTHLDTLCRIFKRDPELIALNEARHKAFKEQLEELRKKLSQLDMFPQSLRIFISYSRRDSMNIYRVRRVAKYLIKVGFDVKLDVLHDKADSVPAFLAYIGSNVIDNGRPRKADVILVMCTPGVPERLLGPDTRSIHHSPSDTLFEELGLIEYRNRHEPAETNRIFPVILSGSCSVSVPDFLKVRATESLNMSSSITFVRAFFNLIQAIYLNDSRVVELTNRAYGTYGEKTGYQYFESPEKELSLFETGYIATASSSQHNFFGAPKQEQSLSETDHIATASSSQCNLFESPEQEQCLSETGHIAIASSSQCNLFESPEQEQCLSETGHIVAASSSQHSPALESDVLIQDCKTTLVSSLTFFHYSEPMSTTPLSSELRSQRQ